MQKSSLFEMESESNHNHTADICHKSTSNEHGISCPHALFEITNQATTFISHMKLAPLPKGHAGNFK
ncbi:hypothetical protein VNO78_27007 [Psophocarpus tetragonolobus]|uniref:Uncharacterized protein n=1 Tax=Psophocarpus tetragonolobus TaxID=3891 RepID=A0AAN9S0A7_PSOTE